MIKHLFFVVGAVFAIALTPMQPVGASIDVFEVCNTTPPSTSKVCQARDDKPLFGPGSIWSNILNAFIFVIGAISVLMIVISGLKYVLSNGDTSQISGAKNTILYSIVGLILSLLSFAIVNFVLVNI